jgi:aldehyde oxidase/xanthine dehydrogenase-like protein
MFIAPCEGSIIIGQLTSAPQTSRVDGRAKVTGAARYAAELNTPGLAHNSIVTSTIAKGHIVRIDASETLRVASVIDVLTHENRPRTADTDQAYKDDVAPPEGSPFRPLYGGKTKFGGQPSRWSWPRIPLSSKACGRRVDSWFVLRVKTADHASICAPSSGVFRGHT